jgi:delta8-fatty-acid desaturase
MCKLVEPASNFYSSKQVAEHNSKDDCWLIYNDKVYDVTDFASRHPGGHKVISSLAGTDATDHIHQFHPHWVVEKALPTYCVGNTQTTPTAATLAYRALGEELEKEGLFKTRYSFYYLKAAWLAFLLGLAVYNRYTIFGAVVLGVYFQQIAFIGHDVGHNSITKDRRTDNTIGIVAGPLLSGVSMSWWKASHNVHHIVTNSVDMDPDVQHMPVFAISNKFFASLYSTYHERVMPFDGPTKFFTSKQHFLFYPIMALARFNLYLQGVIHMASHGSLLEWAALAGFWIWYPTIFMCPQFLTHFLITNAVAGILHVQICISHFPMSTYHGIPTKDKSFLEAQLDTTADISCSKFMDWFHGGLQFQAVHHLYPRVPRHNLRIVHERVKALCKQHNIKYTVLSFVEANKATFSTLKNTAHLVNFFET